jgi:hypothetical protein
MTKTRAWIAGAAAIGLLLVIASWFLLVAPQRSEAASLHEQVTSQRAVNDQIVLKTKQLQAQFASLPQRQAQLAEIRQQMPDNPALPSLVRALYQNAGSAGVELISIAPSTPAALTAPVAAAGAAGASVTAASTGVQQIQTTVIAEGSYAELTLYLQKLQRQTRRVFLVENLALAPIADAAAGSSGGSSGTPSGAPLTKAGPTLRLTITGKVFVLDPAALAAQAGVTIPTAPAN